MNSETSKFPVIIDKTTDHSTSKQHTKMSKNFTKK